MLRHTKDIERLISRRLDGALSPEEELQLDRELIRNPDAHRLMEDYRRIDDLADAALSAAFAEETAPMDLEELAGVQRVGSGHVRTRWLVVGAIAAALAAVFVARTSFDPVTTTTTPMLVDRIPAGTVGDGETRRALPERRSRPKPIDGKKFMRNAAMPLPTRVQRDRGRETIGVLGEDGNIYWIEVDRMRTVRKASPQVVRQWATGGV